jgi:uncharacterized DUF497 family protein
MYIYIALLPDMPYSVRIMVMIAFEWDEHKNSDNQEKHGVSFELAQYAFADPNRVIAEDLSHSHEEKRYYCFGKVAEGIITVRFTYRSNVVRIFGAGYWRRGRQIYEEENRIHR